LDPETTLGGLPGQGPADAGDTDRPPGVSDAAEPPETGHDRPADARPWPPSPAAGLAGDTRSADRSAGWRPTVRPRPPEPRPPRPADASDLPGWRATTGGTPASAAEGFVDPAPSGLRRASLSLPGRIGLAILGWIPLGVAISLVSDAMPACSGMVAVCSDPLRAGIWPIHLLLIVLLVALPRLGVIAAYGAGAFLLVGFGATPVLLAFGGAHTAAGTAAALGVVLIAAWVGGVALALSGRVELPPWRWPRARGPRVR
jgi:cytochrome b561